MGNPSDLYENAEHRILLIDDEPSCVRALTRILKGAGYHHCLGTTDAAEALAIIPTYHPDLILLDWHMGKVNGDEILEKLHKAYTPESMPMVVILTGDCCPETRDKALKAGVSDFLTKPFDSTEAILRIRNLLRLLSLHRHVQSENHRLEEIVEKRTISLQQKIAELKDMQQQVIGDERMHALAAMAGGVAHDFNNALTVIRGYSDLYSHQSEEQRAMEESIKAFEIINLAASDAGEIVRRLWEFCRPAARNANDRRPVDLNRLVTEGVDLSRPKWETQTRAQGLGIDLQTELESLPDIPLAAAEIREVVINLIFNAVDAMPQGGQIAIRTRVEDEQAILEIEDQGIGMTPETRRRCLEPFYSTKGERGTGLGLAIIYGIVQRHEGTVHIHSEINRGTRITIGLPIGRAAEPALSVEEPFRPGRSLKILIVDDDPMICTVVGRLLADDGHHVTSAANGCEALEKFCAGNFDLVITDRVMPKMSGDQLATAIREIKPSEPVILLTGFFNQVRRGADKNLIVAKPVNITSLRRAIDQVLAA